MYNVSMDQHVNFRKPFFSVHTFYWDTDYFKTFNIMPLGVDINPDHIVQWWECTIGWCFNLPLVDVLISFVFFFFSYEYTFRHYTIILFDIHVADKEKMAIHIEFVFEPGTDPEPTIQLAQLSYYKLINIYYWRSVNVQTFLV